MNILYIEEQLSSSLNTKITYWGLDNYTFNMKLSMLSESLAKDKFREFVKHVTGRDDVKLILLDEAKGIGSVLNEKDEVTSYDLRSSLNGILDMILDMPKKSTTVLSKPSWERNCKATSLARYRHKAGRMSILLGLKKEDAFSKGVANYIRIEQARRFIQEIPGIIGTIVRLNIDRISYFVLWEEDNVFALWLTNRKFICFNCNEQTYGEIRNKLWASLPSLVEQRKQKAKVAEEKKTNKG